MIDVRATNIHAVRLIKPARHTDDRGYFSETYHAAQLAEAGIDATFIQDNQSLSVHAGTVRGLHFQSPPFAQAKLVRAQTGRIFDVAVDLRKASPTYGQFVAEELSDENGLQMFIPRGFAHGFCTLTPNTVIAYKVDAYYAAAHDHGINWRDNDLNIPWPDIADGSLLSEKDKALPNLAQIDSPF